MRKALAISAFLGALALARRRYDWSGRVVLVVGGSRGLGLVLARRLGRKGARLMLAARDAEELGRARELLAREGIDVGTVVADVADRESARAMVQETIARHGKLDVLINSASIISVAPLDALTLEDFHDAMNVDFWGTVHACLAALPHLKRSEDARIVNVSSIGGGAIAVPHLLPYTCAKFAVTGFSEGLQAELARTPVRVTTVLPWLMRTGSAQHALVKGRRREEATLFTLTSALPLWTMSAERAAARIVRAVERGKRFLTLGVQGKAVRLLHVVAPGLTDAALRGIAALLPAAPAGQEREGPTEAREHPTAWTQSFLTVLARRAAARLNESRA